MRLPCRRARSSWRGGRASRRSSIWFTCSNVSDDDLRAIGDARIVINVNSMSEIDRILALDLPNPIALRVNPDIGAGHHARRRHRRRRREVRHRPRRDRPRRAWSSRTAGGRSSGCTRTSARAIDDHRAAAGVRAAAARAQRRVRESALHQLRRRAVHPLPAGRARVSDRRLRRGADARSPTARCARADLTAILEPGRYVVAQSGTLRGARHREAHQRRLRPGSAATPASITSCARRSTARITTSSTPRGSTSLRRR